LLYQAEGEEEAISGDECAIDWFSTLFFPKR